MAPREQSSTAAGTLVPNRAERLRIPCDLYAATMPRQQRDNETPLRAARIPRYRPVNLKPPVRIAQERLSDGEPSKAEP